MRRSLPNDDDEEDTMRPVKLLFYALFILALGIYASHALFDGIARTQEAREREQSVITKLELTRVGQNVRVGNSSFLKIAERRGNVR